MIFGFAAAYLVQMISGQRHPGTLQIALVYGGGLFVTQYLNGRFIDLATRPDSDGQPPGRTVSKIIAFFGIALRSIPHAIFLTWVMYMLRVVPDYPNPTVYAIYQIGFPLTSLRKLSVAPLTIIPGTVRLKIDRASELYRQVADSVPFQDWLETLKEVRLRTRLGVRDSLFLMNLIAHDSRVRRDSGHSDS